MKVFFLVIKSRWFCSGGFKGFVVFSGIIFLMIFLGVFRVYIKDLISFIIIKELVGLKEYLFIFRFFVSEG